MSREMYDSKFMAQESFGQRSLSVVVEGEGGQEGWVLLVSESLIKLTSWLTLAKSLYYTVP